MDIIMVEKYLPFTHFHVLDVRPGSFCAPIQINWVLSLLLRRSSSAAKNVEADPRNPCTMSPLVAWHFCRASANDAPRLTLNS